MLIKQIFCRHARQCISINVVKNGKPIFSDWYQPLKALIRNAANTHSANRTMSTIPPQLVVRPNGQLLIDDNLEIKITGLAKHQKTTLHAVTREGSSVFESCCCYTSDENGEVNLATHPSLSGSYTGVSSMGIFWSMVQAPGQREGLRLTKKDMDIPLTTEIAIYDGRHPAEHVHNISSDPLTLGSVDRWYKAQGVKKQVVRDGRLRGILYLPAGDGPFPGVVDMFGTAGGIIEFRSALLASRGFASLSLPYFRYEDLPDSLFDMDFEYFMEAINWMCSHRDVFHDGIGVVGVSKGADIASLMAAHSPKISCVVSINGCTFLAAYPMRYKDGIVMPHVPLQMDKRYMKDNAYVIKDCFNYTKEDLIPVWRNNAKFLNIAGDDDHSSPYASYYLMKEHFPKEKTGDFEIVTYHKAGHLIEPPYSPLTRMSYHKTWDALFLWGGYPEPHAFALEDSWRRILKHFNKYIPRTSNCDIRHTSSKL